MATQRKRKHTTADAPSANKTNKRTKTQTSINSFGSLSKPHAASEEAKKRQTVELHMPSPVAAAKPVDKKRKRALELVEDDEIIVKFQSRKAGLLEQGHGASTPQNKRFKHILPPLPVGTPSKETATLFGKLSIGSKKHSSLDLAPTPSSYQTPPDTPEADLITDEACFPIEIEELQDLYSSFLSALTLYYSHHGTSSPANINALIPAITKHWNKRAVTIDDLRRLLAVDAASDDGFRLEDYGRAGICLTRKQPRGRALKRAASYVDIDGLNSQFDRSLSRLWQKWLANTADRPATEFLKQLSLTEITKNDSAEKAAPLFARGQQRLADIKASQAAAAKSTSTAPKPEAIVAGKPQPHQNRGTALLDRILAKQALASSLPSGPTKSQLERKAALHRIEDVARVLSLLAGAKERSSYSIPVITQQLQQSLRNPISREEVERCLELMATEIAPGYVKLVRSGEVLGVLVVRSGSVGIGELRGRVTRAIEPCIVNYQAALT